MHYAPQALLSCVAWLSLLAHHGNAARGVAPTEVLTHFARAVGTILEPALTSEETSPKINRAAPTKATTINYKASPSKGATSSALRSAVKPRQVSGQDAGGAAAPAGGVAPQNLGPNSNIPFQNQAIPYQYDRLYQYRYPPFAQQFAGQNFYPGLQGFQLPNGLPVDPRFFQQFAGNQPVGPIQSTINKPVDANANANDNVKEIANGNANQGPAPNGEPNSDSKSSAQNGPFGSGGLSPLGQIGASGNFDPNFRSDGRFSAADYDRLRQNYFNNPQIDQQRNYFNSFNEIPFSSGPPYRGSPLGDRFSNLNYNGAGAGGQVANGDVRPGNGVGGIDPYFGSFQQNPYQLYNYNGLAGGNAGGAGAGIGASGAGGGGGPAFDGFRSPFGGLQYPGGFGGQFYPGINGGGPGGAGIGPAGGGGAGLGGGGNEPDERASSSKETISETETPETVQEEVNGSDESATRDERRLRIRFQDDDKENDKQDETLTRDA